VRGTLSLCPRAPPLPHDLLPHLVFLSFVAIAVYMQNLTGFALALVLLGLVGLTNVVPLTDAVNAVSFLTVINATTFLHRRRPFQLEPAIRWSVGAGLVGAVIGMGVLTFLAAHALDSLRTLLGASIIGCALLLWRAAQPYAAVSGRPAFVGTGLLSGILGGLFAAAGPPLVYLMYRQPWPLRRIQEALIFSFGVTALFRLVVLGSTGHIGLRSVLLAAEAVPVVLLVTSLAANRKPPVSREVLKHVVCVLLVVAGVGMLA
jgi:uncharacterized protein